MPTASSLDPAPGTTAGRPCRTAAPLLTLARLRLQLPRRSRLGGCPGPSPSTESTSTHGPEDGVALRGHTGDVGAPIDVVGEALLELRLEGQHFAGASDHQFRPASALLVGDAEPASRRAIGGAWPGRWNSPLRAEGCPPEC
jgi:hypothetical protein